MDAASSASLTFCELKSLYLAHASKHYRRRDGSPTREAGNLKAALDRFEAFAGVASVPARINRHQVRAWIDQLAAEQLSRDYINSCLGRLRRFIRWAADLEYIPLHVDQELRLVRPLAPFRSPAKEHAPRPEISPEQIDTIAAFLPRWARDVIQLLKLTAARPGELVELTNADVHVDDRPRLSPQQHKTAHKGKSRVIPLCPSAVTIVERWARPLCPDDPLFFSDRSTSLTTNSLVQAWSRARAKANLRHIQLYDIRRSVARRVRRSRGLDAAQALLGHARASTTEIYAPIDASESHAFEQARRAAEDLEP